MTLTSTFQRACRLPPHVLARKIAGRVRRHFDAWRARRRDQALPTYAQHSETFEAEFPCYFPLPERALLESRADRIRSLADAFLEHRFDLLGSGWVQVAHGVACRGVEGAAYSWGLPVQPDQRGDWLVERINLANRKEARRLWQEIDPVYAPIDWHLDFKSGARWSEADWYRDVRYGDRPGADVKVPWELGRMQHLPVLAWAHSLDPDSSSRFAREFRNQVLDFLAANPPRFGVQWVCTMDVAIRICNWLVAYDLFRAGGAVFDRTFRTIFHRAVFEHARHIAHNLEWDPELRGNHYLADLVGLVFAASYLPASPQTNAWLALGLRELVREVALQFDEDGANFEASTSYHRLSAEMVVWATALVLGLPDERLRSLRHYDQRLIPGPAEILPAPLPLHRIPGGERLSPFPPWYFERLRRMALFTAHVTRPDGRVPQIGDNDSGRFLKLDPEEDPSCHAGLTASIAGLLDRGAPLCLEASILRQLAPEPRVACAMPATASLMSWGGIELCPYPRFGLFVYRMPQVYLAVRCGPVGQNGHGGHAHNDQLSIELCVDDVPFIVDPGTYLYTASPEQRNHFRSTAMHNTLAFSGREQNDWLEGTAGLFRMVDRSRSVVQRCQPNCFVGEHRGYGVPCRRTLLLEQGSIKGIDECELDGSRDVWFHLAPGVAVVPGALPDMLVVDAGTAQVRFQASEGTWVVEETRYSPGYGVVEPCRAVRLRSEARRIEWRIGWANR